MFTLTTFPVIWKSPSKEIPTKKTPFQSYWLSSARGCCKRCHHCHRHPFGATECTSLWFPRGLSDLQRAWMKWSPDGIGRWFHKIGFKENWMYMNWYYFFWGGASNIKDVRYNTHVLTLEDGLSRVSVLRPLLPFLFRVCWSCFLWQSIGSTSVQSGRFSLPSRIVDGFLGGPCPPSSSHVWNRCHPPSSLKMATRLLIGAVLFLGGRILGKDQDELVAACISPLFFNFFPRSTED